MKTYVIPHPYNKGEGIIEYDSESATISEKTLHFLLVDCKLPLERIILNLTYLASENFNIPKLDVKPAAGIYQIMLDRETFKQLENSAMLGYPGIDFGITTTKQIKLYGKQLWVSA